MSITTTLKKSVNFGRTASADANCVMEYVCDTGADVANLPTVCLAGSRAYVVLTGESYILNSHGIWCETGTAESLLADRRGELPHILTVDGTAALEVVSVGGWDLSVPKTIADGAWVYNGWKLKITVSAGYFLTVNGDPVELTGNVGYYTVGAGTDVDVVITEV